MSITDRKTRQRAEREARIVAAARLIAEREGWAAVTIRRLADEIEHSQPVIYSHFANRDAIVAAVALQGFVEIAAALQDAARQSRGPRQVLEHVATAYVDFALRCTALYEVMFVLPTDLRFAADVTRPELRAAFDALRAALTPFCAEADVATETLWASLHGLAELERAGRIRPGTRAERILLLVRGLERSGT